MSVENGGDVAVPDRVYRYLRINEHLEDFITFRNIYLSSRTQFNDPYDCKFRVSAECSFETFACKARDETSPLFSLLSKIYPGASLQKRIEFGYRDRHDIFSDEKPLKGFNSFADKTGLFCVSETETSLLMWSHYAHQHQGVCVELNAKDSEVLQNLYPIRYSDEIPVYRIFEDDLIKMTTGALCVKSNDWSYEREWRIFGSELAGKKLNLQKGAITRVILGSRISDENQRLVVEMVRKSGDFVTIERAQIKSDRYELEFVKV